MAGPSVPHPHHDLFYQLASRGVQPSHAHFLTSTPIQSFIYVTTAKSWGTPDYFRWFPLQPSVPRRVGLFAGVAVFEGDTKPPVAAMAPAPTAESEPR